MISQHSMLGRPVSHVVSIYTYKFQYSTLAFSGITLLHNERVYKEYYQHLCYQLRIIYRGLLLFVQMEDIADIVKQIFHYSIQQYHDENFRHLC